MALAHSNGMERGTRAPNFDLPGVDGKRYSLDSFQDAKVLVVVFTCNHCPYAQAAEERLIAIQRDYAERGVQLVAISSNDAERYQQDSFDNMQKRAAAQGYIFPYLYDETQQTARAYDAACTPDIFVFDDKRALRYNGRIDDNWQVPQEVTREDLRSALDAVLEGNEIDFEVVPSMGCSIKWKQ